MKDFFFSHTSSSANAVNIQEKRHREMYRIEHYFRKTKAHPEGSYCHDGDCRIFSTKICTCGLLHLLLPVGNASQLYPPFQKELSLQEQVLEGGE